MLAVVALAPVAVLVVVGLAGATQVPWRPLVAEGQSLSTGLGVGLAVVMWNYSGWDTPSTCLGEAEAPEHAFRRALFVALPVIAAAYLLPVGAVLATGRHRLVGVEDRRAAGAGRRRSAGRGSATPSPPAP